jgi:hypothetical protein
LQKILEGLDDQEINILRFSLIKDLLIIMRADYYEGLEEKKFLEKTKKILQISEEHMKFFEEEYLNDKIFFEQIIIDDRKEYIKKEFIAGAAALGIPLTIMYPASIFGDYRLFKAKTPYWKKKREKVSAQRLGATILMSIFSYKSVKWILDQKKRKDLRFKELVFDEALKTHERAVEYIIKDLKYIENKIKIYEENFRETDGLTGQKILLEKVLAAFNNSEPKIV